MADYNRRLTLGKQARGPFARRAGAGGQRFGSGGEASATGGNSFRTVSYFTLVFGGVRDIRACKRLGIGPGRPSTPTETIMFTKTLLAALILATASIAVTSKVNAGPLGQ